VIGRCRKQMIKYSLAQSKLSIFLNILLFLLIISLPVVLITLYLLHLPNSVWHVFSFSFLIVTAILGYIARKARWVKPFSPKQRRLRSVFVFGIISSLPIIIVWREISGSLPPYSFIIFLILFAVGAYLGDSVGKKFKVF